MRSQAVTTSVEVSAGGLIVSKSDPSKVALICHLNRGGAKDWCLPKGHVESNETLEETAAREVFEETGLAGEVVSKLGEINYSFRVGHTRIRKTVHHYLLREISGNLTADGDPTGEVLEVRWFPLDELVDVLAHENEKKMALKALELLR
ncbi:MAG: NUDIX hydrolase [Aquiluna sp.]|nr:NUDIX hydrolase [Aquiluna sp.]